MPFDTYITTEFAGAGAPIAHDVLSKLQHREFKMDLPYTLEQIGVDCKDSMHLQFVRGICLS